MLVFNNHSASILVGERYPIFEANITDEGTLTEAFDTYIPVGIQLEVTPTIMTNGKVSLLVHPVTSSLGDDVVGTTGLRVRRILTREIDTRVIMGDGQTIVLGGLISDRKTRVVNKTPGLGDLPVLDIFFRQENPRSERVDLLVFMTVRIEGATDIGERDRAVYETYQPHFKHVERLQDVPLHFEIPTEYQGTRPMFGDPPDEFSEQSEETVVPREEREPPEPAEAEEPAAVRPYVRTTSAVHDKTPPIICKPAAEMPRTKTVAAPKREKGRVPVAGDPADADEPCLLMWNGFDPAFKDGAAADSAAGGKTVQPERELSADTTVCSNDDVQSN
jgi:hypothetical protein